MNSSIFWIYLAVGSFTKLITLKHATPGGHWAARLQILVGAYIASLIVPPDANNLAAALIIIPHAAAVLGVYLATGIDKARVWWEMRK